MHIGRRIAAPRVLPAAAVLRAARVEAVHRAAVPDIGNGRRLRRIVQAVLAADVLHVMVQGSIGCMESLFHAAGIAPAVVEVER